MDFTSYASSSEGNLYRVQSGETALLIEAGLSLPAIRKALDFKAASCSGCLVSHEHGDHAKGAADLMRFGMDLYCSQGTADALGLCGPRLHILKDREPVKIGGLAVLPFRTEHDCAEPLGFLIADGVDKLLFATDTHYLRWRFQGLTMIAIECNFAEDLIEDLEPFRKARLLRSHMSLENVKALLMANDLSRVREIHLLHLSSENADGPRFKKEIQQLTGKPVYIKE